jgi:PQQ-dependent dehydrogenase (s-GDH family)
MRKILLAIIIATGYHTAQSQCSGTGSINFQRWNSITGSTVASLTSNVNYPNNPSTSGTRTSFEMQSNITSNFGARMYGYLCAPTTGNYVFWIAADDASELWLSTTDSPAQKIKIAYNNNYTSSRQWTKYSSQKSASIALVAGQVYYIEALMKESSGNDNLAVGWSKPSQSTSTASQVIPGSSLKTSHITDTQAPTAPTGLLASNITNTSCTLSWVAATDNIAVTGYNIYKGSTKINSSLIALNTGYAVTGLNKNAANTLTVQAVDAAGNSSTSNPITVNTLSPVVASESFTMRTILALQSMPHELIVAPDSNLWFIERFAGRVNYVNPITNAKTIVHTLGSNMARTGGQDGLFGLAIHPGFVNGQPYVYLAYTYQSTSATVRKTRIQRFEYEPVSKTLINPITIIENLPGSNDHNSGRLTIGPDNLLYYSIGDMGAGQYDNASRANNSQSMSILEGKILRFHTELTNGSWIPSSNPFTVNGSVSPIYSLGHRNPQGLVWGQVNSSNILYSTEHGPFSDDEINTIEAGRNYGWPQVAGFCDNNYNGKTVGGFAIVNEVANCTTLNAKEPLAAIYATPTPPTGGDNMLWPSVGPSGTDFYGSSAIPGWQNSLLIATLKGGALYRYKLSTNGQSLESDSIPYFKGKGRFRDVAVSADGLKIYLACDSTGSTSGPTGGVLTLPPNPGSILEFSYNLPNGRIAAKQPTKNTVENSTKVKMYPNPANTELWVEGSDLEAVYLIDFSGKIIEKIVASLSKVQVKLTGLASGSYLIKTQNKKGKFTVDRIVVQH